jgi:hypothetical protein
VQKIKMVPIKGGRGTETTRDWERWRRIWSGRGSLPNTIRNK